LQQTLSCPLLSRCSPYRKEKPSQDLITPFLFRIASRCALQGATICPWMPPSIAPQHPGRHAQHNSATHGGYGVLYGKECCGRCQAGVRRAAWVGLAMGRRLCGDRCGSVEVMIRQPRGRRPYRAD